MRIRVAVARSPVAAAHARRLSAYAAGWLADIFDAKLDFEDSGSPRISMGTAALYLRRRIRLEASSQVGGSGRRQNRWPLSQIGIMVGCAAAPA